MGVTIASVSAVDDSNSTDDLGVVDESDSPDSLSAVEDAGSVENLSKSEDVNSNDNLSSSQSSSEEVLSMKVNSDDNIISASNGHSYFVGGYKFTLSDKEFKQLKNYKVRNVYVKTNSKIVVKVPKYKTKKVTKHKWKYKKVKTEAFKPYTYDTVKLNDLNKYYKKGWKTHSTGFKSYKNQEKYLGYNYVVLKKKVSYKVKKKVKSGYKKIKTSVVGKVSMGGYGTPYIYYYAGNLKDHHWYEVLGWYDFDF